MDEHSGCHHVKFIRMARIKSYHIIILIFFNIWLIFDVSLYPFIKLSNEGVHIAPTPKFN